MTELEQEIATALSELERKFDKLLGTEPPYGVGQAQDAGFHLRGLNKLLGWRVLYRQKEEELRCNT